MPLLCTNICIRRKYRGRITSGETIQECFHEFMSRLIYPEWNLKEVDYETSGEMKHNKSIGVQRVWRTRKTKREQHNRRGCGWGGVTALEERGTGGYPGVKGWTAERHGTKEEKHGRRRVEFSFLVIGYHLFILSTVLQSFHTGDSCTTVRLNERLWVLWNQSRVMHLRQNWLINRAMR